MFFGNIDETNAWLEYLEQAARGEDTDLDRDRSKDLKDSDGHCMVCTCVLFCVEYFECV